MKKIFLAILVSFLSFNAYATQLICESSQQSADGKAMRVYKVDSKLGTIERFAYIPSKGGYALFGQLANLTFSDDLYNMTPLRRIISAKSGNKEVLQAIWGNGNPIWHAKINDDVVLAATCKSKE